MNARSSLTWLMLATTLSVASCTAQEDEDSVSVGGKAKGDRSADAGADASQAEPALDAGLGPSSDASRPDSGAGLAAFPGLDAGAEEPGLLVDGGGPPAADGVGCLARDSEQLLSVTSGGGCLQPVVVDLTAASYGDVTRVQLPRAPGDLTIGARDKCGLKTATDVVLRVQLPPAADLEAAVEVGDAQVALRVFEVNSDPCLDVPIACTDEADEASCTYLRVTQAMLGTASETTLVLSEYVDSGLPWTLRLRVQDPRTGS